MEENESLYGEQAEEVVTPQADDAAEAEGAESSDTPDRDRQTQADNRRYQAARHAGEQAGYERAMQEINRRIARTGMRDSSTGQAIDSIEGLENYSKEFRKKQIEARAKAEGRSVAEVAAEEEDREFMREARAEREAKRKQDEEEAAFQKWLSEDFALFTKTYPDVDVGKLEDNRAFRKFCGSRYGREPLADLYGDWLDIAKEAQLSAVTKTTSKTSRSTGAGGGSGSDTLTAKQQRALDEWNRENPDMKMTAKEFLSRM